MPNGYMMDIWVVVTDSSDRMLQSMRETLLVGFEVRPATLKLASRTPFLLRFSMRHRAEQSNTQ